MKAWSDPRWRAVADCKHCCREFRTQGSGATICNLCKKKGLK